MAAKRVAASLLASASAHFAQRGGGGALSRGARRGNRSPCPGQARQGSAAGSRRDLLGLSLGLPGMLPPLAAAGGAAGTGRLRGAAVRPPGGGGDRGVAAAGAGAGVPVPAGGRYLRVRVMRGLSEGWGARGLFACVRGWGGCTVCSGVGVDVGTHLGRYI